MTPGQAAERLGALPIAETLATALEEHAKRLATAMRDGLANPAGGPHDRPWRETGALQESITVAVDGLAATIASADPAAAPQELGTATDPPRPFLAPAAAAHAAEIATDIGRRVAELIGSAAT